MEILHFEGAIMVDVTSFFNLNIRIILILMTIFDAKCYQRIYIIVNIMLR